MLSDLKSSRLRELHAILAEMRTRGPYDDRVGICANVVDGNQLRDSYHEELCALFWMWPEFSGNLSCPVAHPDGLAAAYAYETLPKWPSRASSEAHPYAAARMRLLEHCIVVIDAELTLRADNGSFVWK